MISPIRESTVVEMNEDTLVIKTMNVDLQDIVLRGKGGVERTVDFSEFYNGIAAGTISIPGHSPKRTQKSWSPTEYAEGVFRSEIVKLIESDRYCKYESKEQEDLLKKLAVLHSKKVPSAKTIKGYQRKFANGGFDALLPDFSRRGGCGWTKKTEQKLLAKEMIDQIYAKDDKINITTITVLINDKLKDNLADDGNPQKISSRTVSRIIHSLPRDQVLTGRVDPRTYRLASRQAVKAFHVENAFQLMQVDAKTIDQYVIDEFGNRYTQITLYSMVCSRTGYPVGIFVTPGAPSEYTLLKLFEFFFSPKDDDFKARFGIATQWPAPCGIAKVLLDNASENSGGVALEIVRDLGIEIHYARPNRGDDKPYVESLFKTLEQRLFKRMPGAKKSSEPLVENRHERAEKEACYSVEEIYQNIVRFIADVYVHESCEKLGFRHGRRMSIKNAMDEELKRFMPPPPPSLAQVQRLVLQKNRVIRKVQHYGVDFEGLQYHSYEFANLTRVHFIKEVEVLFNPSHCTSVYVVNPLTSELIKLDCKMQNIPDVSFDIIRDVRKRYKGTPSEISGHDYQRIYASMLASFHADSRRRKKVKDNNQAARQQSKQAFHREVKAQLEMLSSPRVEPVNNVQNMDDEFVPAPRTRK
tara:strand:- start:5999 stop:7918 length:1920 start_codon:yes stop_codon:yes gene_type:complete